MNKNLNYWSRVLNLIKNRLVYFVILIWILVALFASVIVGKNPILYKNDTGIHLNLKDKKISSASQVYMMPLWQIDPGKIDLKNRYLKPLSPSLDKTTFYILGTDHLGRDVLAGLIRGASPAFLIGFGAMLISLILGVLIGIPAGWFENSGIRFSRLTAIIIFLCLLFIFLISILVLQQVPGNSSSNLLMYWLIILLILFTIARWFYKRDKRLPHYKLDVHLPLDSIVSRMIESLSAIPALVLIMIFAAFFMRHSVLSLVIIIGVLRWTTIARYSRAETIRLKSQPFIVIANRRYYSIIRMWVQDLFPHVAPALVGLAAYSVAGAIMSEAALSFLGLGLPPDIPGWGSMLSSAIRYPSAWWLYLFPGLILVIVLLSLHKIGDEYLNQKGIKGRNLNWKEE
jgi:peptide/nickel transport system permease protein